MKKLILALLLTLITSEAYSAYLVNVTRKSQDFYVTGNGNVILTQQCFEFAYGDEAVLFWDYPTGTTIPYGGRLVFKNGQACDVQGVF